RPDLQCLDPRRGRGPPGLRAVGLADRARGGWADDRASPRLEVPVDPLRGVPRGDRAPRRAPPRPSRRTMAARRGRLRDPRSDRGTVLVPAQLADVLESLLPPPRLDPGGHGFPWRLETGSVPVVRGPREPGPAAANRGLGSGSTVLQRGLRVRVLGARTGVVAPAPAAPHQARDSAAALAFDAVPSARPGTGGTLLARARAVRRSRVHAALRALRRRDRVRRTGVRDRGSRGVARRGGDDDARDRGSRRRARPRRGGGV